LTPLFAMTFRAGRGAEARLASAILVKKQYVSRRPVHAYIMPAFCVLGPCGRAAMDQASPTLVFAGDKLLLLLAKHRLAPI
jgi:hypothetical protein